MKKGIKKLEKGWTVEEEMGVEPLYSDKIQVDVYTNNVYTNKDLEGLSKRDRGILKQIDGLIFSLSKKGKEYWQTYYS